MANKRLIQGIAGCGKTYFIANDFEENKKVLILSFTNGNVNNIKNELKIRFNGCIPNYITIKTFDTFILEDLIYPFPKMISDIFNKNLYRIVCGGLESPKKQTKYKVEFKFTKDDYRRYFNREDKLYNETACYLVKDMYKIKKNWNKVIERLELVYDQIYVDEYQDFRMKKYEVLEIVIKKYSKPITLVGDYYQQGLSGVIRSGKPFKDVDYESHHKNMKALGLDIDDETLSKTRRCSISISNYINSKYEFDFETKSNVRGCVRELNLNEIEEYLRNDTIPKLIVRNAKKYLGNFINYSYSKGNTYENAVIIQTEDINLTYAYYVALSRAKNSLFLIKYEDWKKVEEKFIHE